MNWHKPKRILIKKTVQLEERRTKVKDLQEQTKSLKRKLEVRKEFMPMAKRLKLSEGKVSRFERKTKELKQENLKVKLKAEIREAKKVTGKLTKEIKELNENLKCEKQKREQIKLEKSESEKENVLTKAEQAQIKDLDMSIDYLQSLLEYNSELALFDEVNKKINTELVECVMNLTSFKVSSEQVYVISEVCKLCEKQPNRLPSRSTVDRIVDSKASVSHKQIAQVLKSKENITLYSDETRKYGHPLETFAVTDAEQNS
jgi:chromosome segregation ATPase